MAHTKCVIKVTFCSHIITPIIYLQLFSPYNILWLKEILENQKNYVTAQVNLAHFQKLMKIFFRSFLEFFRVSYLAVPSYLFDIQHDSIVYHLFGIDSE